MTRTNFSWTALLQRSLAASVALLSVFAIDSARAGEIEAFQRYTSPNVSWDTATESISFQSTGRFAYRVGSADFSGSDTARVEVLSRNVVTGEISTAQVWESSVGLSESGVLTRDDRHLYVAGTSSIEQLAVDRDSGQLSLIESVLNTFVPFYPTKVVLSPDQRNLYVFQTINLTSAISIYSRDLLTGSLEFVDIVMGGQDGVVGTHLVRDAAFTDDGEFIYVVSSSEDSVTVFSRSVITGSLTFVEQEQDEPGVGPPLESALTVSLSHDGEHVYVGARDGVALFDRNEITGSLSPQVSSGASSAGVHGFQISADDTRAYVAHDSDFLLVYERDPLTGVLHTADLVGEGVGSLENFQAGQLKLSPYGRHLYAISGEQTVIGFATRVLDLADTESQGSGPTGLNRPLDVAWSPDARFAYVASDLSSSVTAFRVDPGVAGAPDQLAPVQTIFNTDPGIDGLAGAVDVEVSPDGTQVFVVSQFDDALVSFTRNASTGRLTFDEIHRDGSNFVNGLDEASGLAISPDGTRVYVTSFSENSVSVFDRKTETGGLTYLGQFANGDGGAFGMTGATDVSVSPDNAHVYVTGFLDHGVAIFASTSAGPGLSYIDTIVDGSGIDGLESPVELEFSPDGVWAYVASRAGAVSIFNRNRTNGFLSFFGHIENSNADLVYGLNELTSIDLSFDGRYLAVTSTDGTIAVFVRDSENGELWAAHVEQFGGVASIALAGASSVVFSPEDGAYDLLATGADGDSLVLFVPEPSGGAPLALGTLVVLGTAAMRQRATGRML